jgi:molybdate transport system substrate-binding protein
LAISLVGEACGRSLNVAVASNFHLPAKHLATEFITLHEVEVEIIAGASGVLTAQIQQGAPFDLFLAADMAYPQFLHEQGRALAPEPYAQGTLVWWHPQQSTLPDTLATVVIADPLVAPYGRAAQAVLEAHIPAPTQVVHATNINHAFTLIDTGHVGLGLISLSHLRYALMRFEQGKYVNFTPVAPDAYPRLTQGATIVAQNTDGNNAELARKFLDFIQAPAQQRYLQQMGYTAL